MHLSHVDTRLPALAGVLVGAVVTLLAVLPELGALDLSFGGGGSAETVTTGPVVAEPAWVEDPMAPPALLAR